MPLPDVWHQFVQSLQPVDLPRGSVILRDDARTDVLHVTRSGKAKTTCRSTDRQEVLLDFHAQPALLDDGPSATATVAITDVRTGRISVSDLHKWLVLCPEVSEDLLAALARRERQRHQMRLDMVQISAPARLAKALLRLAGRLIELPWRACSLSKTSTGGNWLSTSARGVTPSAGRSPRSLSARARRPGGTSQRQ